jgi:hypothetical protein
MQSAIAAGWPGPNDLVLIIASYAIFSDEENTMITLLERGAARRTRSGTCLAGIMISWPSCDWKHHWFSRRYNIHAGHLSSPVVAFHQLFPRAEWWRLMPASMQIGYFSNYAFLVGGLLKEGKNNV